MLTIKKVLKAIGDKRFDLYKVDDYFVMTYEDFDSQGKLTAFETVSIMVPRVGDLDLTQWVSHSEALLHIVMRKAA